MAEPETEVVVRRRRSLMAAGAGLSAALAAGYVWRFAASASATSLAVGVVLAVVALCFGYAWLDARAPLLVADANGLRIRLGSAWTGVPWELVEVVEVEERGSVRDGQVTVLPASTADVLAGASRRSRWAAWLNRWLYDAPLVVPFGLTTAVSAPDVASALGALSAGRSPVVVVNGPHPEPEATVELAPSRAVAAGVAVSEVPAAAAWAETQLDAPAHEEVTVDVPVVEVPLVKVPLVEVPAAAASVVEEPAETQSDDPADDAPAVPKPRRKHWISRTSSRFGASRTPVSDYTATPARREDVTIAARSSQPTIGSLALSSDPVTSVSEALPEISHLRRPSDPDHSDSAGDGGLDQATSSATSMGNVSLIIDATTDITARAMQRVRTPQPVGAFAGRPVPERPASDVPLAGTVIGSQLTEARVTLGLSIDELAERTRIRPYVIESIEVDDFSPCGGDFYARGHLRMLARVLGIESSPLIQAYDARFASTPVNARKVFEVELATGSTGMVRGNSSGANWWALMAAVLALLLVWGVARFVSAGPEPAAPADTSTGIGAQHVPNASSGRSSSPPVQVSPAKAQVKLTASGADSRVTVLDGRHHLLFRGVLVDGTTKKFQGRAPLRVRAADAGAIRLSVKGRSLGPVGSSGVAAHRLVSASDSASSPSSQRRQAG